MTTLINSRMTLSTLASWPRTNYYSKIEFFPLSLSKKVNIHLYYTKDYYSCWQLLCSGYEESYEILPIQTSYDKQNNHNPLHNKTNCSVQ